MGKLSGPVSGTSSTVEATYGGLTAQQLQAAGDQFQDQCVEARKNLEEDYLKKNPNATKKSVLIATKLACADYWTTLS